MCPTVRLVRKPGGRSQARGRFSKAPAGACLAEACLVMRRPRLKLHGVAAMSERELVRLLLRDAESLVALLAQEGEDVLAALARLRVPELVARGFTRGDAEAVVAAFEVGRRIGGPMPVRKALDDPEAAFAFLARQLVHEEREVVLAVVLDVRNRPTHVAKVALGGVDHCAIDPREVFVPAVRERGSAVLLAHNHPSGEAAPSREDIALTRRLVEAGALLGLPLLDHLIVAGAGAPEGAPKFVSLASLGLVAAPKRAGRR
jgi:DNA repair protein RadC